MAEHNPYDSGNPDGPPPPYGGHPYAAPGYGAPPSGYGAPPPPGYGAPPPGYGAPPPGYGAPPPGYGAPPPSAIVPAGAYSMGYPPAPPGPDGAPPKASVAGDKFLYASSKWNDVWAAILFILQFLAVLVFSVVLGVKGVSSSSSSQQPAPGQTVYSFSDYAPQFAAAAATGLVFALVWLQLIKLMPRMMVHISLWFGFVAPVAVAIVVFVYHTAPAWVGVVLLLSSLLQLLYIWLVRHRIPFSATILKHAVHVVNTFPSVIWVAYLFLLLSLVWTVIWVVGVSGAMSLTNAFAVLIILVLSNYWTMEVFRNVVHTTVAGTTATYYFLRHNMPPNPTGLALHRAATKSFGSICFGSLLVALIQTLRFIVAALANNDDGGNFIACCAQCILACIEAIVEFFNKYAYIQIAMYGKTFIRASKDTWELFKARGVDVLINDDLSGGVLGLGMFIGGVVAALVGGLLSLNKAVELLAAVSIVSFIIGLVLTGMTLTVVDSAVGTFYVCYAEDPATLQQNDPVLYNKVQERDREIRDRRTRHDAQAAARQASR